MTFRDASGTQTGQRVSGGTSDGTTTREDQTIEDFEIPASTTTISVRADDKPNDGSTYFTRRAMLNRGPVAAPYSDPHPQDAENLLPFSALVEQTTTTGFLYLNKEPLDNLGLEVGDVISASMDLHGDGGGTSSGQILLRYWDSGGSEITPLTQSGETAQGSTTYEREFIHGEVIPPNTHSITVRSDNANNDGSTISSRRAMLNRGARAAPFTAPNFKELLDDAASIWRDLGSQTARVADVVDRLRDDGQAQQDFRINGFPFNSHTEQQSAGDGESPTFNQDYASTPKVHFVPQRARSYLSSQDTVDQRIKMAAVNPSASGFDLKAVVEYGSTTTTDHDDGFSASRNTAAPENGGASISAEGAAIYCNVEDADGTDNGFTVTYDIDTTGMDSNDALTPLATVHIEYSDAATGGNWTEAGSQSYGPDQNLTDEQFSFSATLSADYDIRLRLTYSVADAEGEATLTGHGEDGTPPGVQFSTNDSALTEESMTPRSTDKVYWEAKEVAV